MSVLLENDKLSQWELLCSIIDNGVYRLLCTKSRRSGSEFDVLHYIME